jgi:hypothetical protein
MHEDADAQDASDEQRSILTVQSSQCQTIRDERSDCYVQSTGTE